VDRDIITTLFPYITTSNKKVSDNGIILLCNLCAVPDLKKKNIIINNGIFECLQKKLIKLSPPTGNKIETEDYYPVERICTTIINLIHLNPDGVSSFITSGLIPFFLRTLEITNNMRDSISDGEKIGSIQWSVCGCLSSCTFLSFQHTKDLVELKVIGAMIAILEHFISRIKKKKPWLDEQVVENACYVLFNISFDGSIGAASGAKNEFIDDFKEVDGIKRLFNIFEYLLKQRVRSLKQNEIINYIAITICHLLKSDIVPSAYVPVLNYVDEIETTPSSQPGVNFPEYARNALREIISDGEF
jgi:hypothetical protein